MTLLEIDITGEVTRLTLEAETALGRGETVRARKLFEQAGTRLKAAAERIRRRGERDAGMYLAATQFFKGGLYEEALHLCRHIQASKLPPNVNHSYPAFFE